jgi:hypothetical protein
MPPAEDDEPIPARLYAGGDVRTPLPGAGPPVSGQLSPAPDRSDRINHFYAWLERSHTWALLAFTAIYLSAVLDVVRGRWLWEDELFTYALARLPSGELWRALLTGADQHPFLFYRLAGALLWATTPEIALRIPSVVAGLLLALGLYAYVAPRTSPTYGLVAMLAVMTTRAWTYAHEARGYEALAAGLTIAFVGWAAAPTRRWGAFVLGAGLIYAASNHYYVVFGFGVLAVAELVRSLGRRRVEWSVWIAFCALGIPLFANAPLLRASRPYGTAFWGHPNALAIPLTYDFLVGPALVPLLLLGSAATVYSLRRRPRGTSLALPVSEVVALLGFVALPAITVAGSLVTGAYTPRYALPTVIGVAVFATLGLYGSFSGRQRPGLAAAILLAGWCEWQSLRDVSDAVTRNESQQATAAWMAALGADTLALVAWQPGTFLELAHYGPPDLKRRLVYVADADLARRYLGTDTSGRSLLALRPWFPPAILSYKECIRAQRFLLFGDGADNTWRNWMLSRVMDDGARLTLVGRHGDRLVFLVEMGAQDGGPHTRPHVNPAR